VVAPSRSQSLEREAGEYGRCRSQHLEIQKTLDGMLALLPANGQDGAAVVAEVPVVAPSRLQNLEREAGEYGRCRPQHPKLDKTLDGMLALLSANDQDCAAVVAEVPVVAPSRLQVLERKAGEYERCRAQYLELQKTLDGMLALLPANGQGGAAAMELGVGRLSELIEKAAKADVLAHEVDEVRVELDRVQRKFDTLKKEVETARAERDKEAVDFQTYKDEAEKWKTKTAGLRETVERLLLGEFEYYEVKEGDTLLGIAANPLVYGDPARATWLRQVNEDRVKHLDNLRKGEVLIVPRFPRNGSYEF